MSVLLSRQLNQTNRLRSYSYVCPLARAVLTYAPGGTVEIAGEEAVILEIR